MNKISNEETKKEPVPTSSSGSSEETKAFLEVGHTETKKKKKRPSICLTHCRYGIVHKVAENFNLKHVRDEDNWDLFWSDYFICIGRCREMKRFQRINHFPGMLEICRKDLLAKNLNNMLKSFPSEYSFFPKTWCLPGDLADLLRYSVRKNKTYILKPFAGNQGRGIFITKSVKDIKPTEKLICQVYITRPFLIDGFKFDLRVYTLITCCDPLRIYVYDEGLVRFATVQYREPTENNTMNVFMHLTNYAVNKHSRKYNKDDEEGSKRKLSWFNNYLRALGYDVKGLWQKIDDVIIKTIFSILPVLRHSYRSCFPNHDIIPACCELLGMDIILDRSLLPQLLEVNHSPSFHTDTALDAEVKKNLLTDLFAMLNLEHCDKRKIMKEDRKRVEDEYYQRKLNKDVETKKNIKVDFTEYHAHETKNKGNYRLIYPAKRQNAYSKFLRQTQNADTCREVVANDFKRKSKDPRLSSQLVPQPVTSTFSNFKPDAIVESEERERIMGLANRDFLVRSYGMVDHIYLLLKENGYLRPTDIKKYNKIKYKKSTEKVTPSIQPYIQEYLDFHAKARCQSADSQPCNTVVSKSRSPPKVPRTSSKKQTYIQNFPGFYKMDSKRPKLLKPKPTIATKSNIQATPHPNISDNYISSSQPTQFAVPQVSSLALNKYRNAVKSVWSRPRSRSVDFRGRSLEARQAAIKELNVKEINIKDTNPYNWHVNSSTITGFNPFTQKRMW